MWNHCWSWNESAPLAADLVSTLGLPFVSTPVRRRRVVPCAWAVKRHLSVLTKRQLDSVIERVVSDAALEFRGIHLFSGTQILDHTVLVRQYRKGIEIALGVARRLERPLRTLDFGGGLGIPYFPGEAALNMESLRNEVDTLMLDVRREPLFSGTRFMLEPGRYLVGEAGIYVARVTT